MRAAQSGARRAIAQSIAFIYPPGEIMRTEDDPLDLAAEGVRQSTVQGIIELEQRVLTTADIDGIVLRYGYFYGPDTWYDQPPKPPSVHVDAAAHAAVIAVSTGGGSLQCRRGLRDRVQRQSKARIGLRPGVQDVALTLYLRRSR